LTGAGSYTALLSIEDLTARKRAADQLHHAEENYRQLLEHAHDGVLVVDENGAIEFANPRLEEMFGYAVGELRTKPYELLIPARYADVHQKHHAMFMRNPEARDMDRAVEIFGRRKDGRSIPLEISLSPFKVDSRTMITALVRDISTRKKIEEERQALLVREREARRDAERSNRVKDEFLATLSHELRTPLSTILIWAQILRLKSATVEQVKKAATVIEKSAKDQGQLIEDLLDVSRIQAGKVRLELREIDPVESITAALDSIRTEAEDKSIAIHTEFDQSPCRIVADSGRLQQVLRNLLTNAVKFTPAGGTITIQSRLLKDPGRLEIQVRDTGKGISAEFLPYVFKRFSQEDPSAKREFGGLGLGLSIVRNLVEMHGGTVAAESPGEGQGAVFTVTLPYPSAILPQEVAVHVDDVEGMARDTAAPPELSGLRILIIDDQQDTREALQTVLESLGARVHSAGGAADGLAAFAGDQPDVVLCDLAMPGEDGFSVIRKIRALAPDQGGRVPVVALTAYAEAETVRKCLDAGFDAHLSKPTDAADLARLIVELAGRPHPES
jgi:PAS domain S-box-containing protein